MQQRDQMQKENEAADSAREERPPPNFSASPDVKRARRESVRGESGAGER